MKIAVLLLSFVASVSAKAIRGWRGFNIHEAKLFSDRNTTELLLHGSLGDTHCEELFIPVEEVKSFLSDPHEAPYKKYKRGLCPLPFNTIDSVYADDDFPDVTHLKRGIGAKAASSLTVTSCGSSSAKATKLKFAFNGSPTKGNPTTITGTMSIPTGSTGGYFYIDAKIGSTTLINHKETNNCNTFSQSIPLVGTITATTCPNGTSDSLSVTIPVPNINGQVSATMQSFDSNKNELFCANLVLNL